MHFLKGRFETMFVPTVYESYTLKMEEMTMAIWDTPGVREFDRLRPLCYPETHVFLVCYAVNQPRSLDQIEDFFISEIKQQCSHTPLLVVGLKNDLRKGSDGFVSVEQATLVSQRINAYNYMECSAKTGDGVQQVLDQAAQAALDYSPIKSRKRCVIL